MRPVQIIALIGSMALAAAASAQSLTEHAAAAAGATAGTAAGKPVSTALTNIFGQVDQVTATAAGAKTKPKAPRKSEADADTRIQALKSSSPQAGDPESISSEPEPSTSRAARVRASRARQVSVKVVALVPAPPSIPAPEVKEPSLEDLASIKIGASAQELQAALGPPASHIIVPDDDGHLRESCQYWAKGKQLGTVRLDNGQVVKVELRIEN